MYGQTNCWVQPDIKVKKTIMTVLVICLHRFLLPNSLSVGRISEQKPTARSLSVNEAVMFLFCFNPPVQPFLRFCTLSEKFNYRSAVDDILMTCANYNKQHCPQQFSVSMATSLLCRRSHDSSRTPLNELRWWGKKDCVTTFSLHRRIVATCLSGNRSLNKKLIKINHSCLVPLLSDKKAKKRKDSVVFELEVCNLSCGCPASLSRHWRQQKYIEITVRYIVGEQRDSNHLISTCNFAPHFSAFNNTISTIVIFAVHCL